MTDRITIVRAMETIARCVNDETVFETWLVSGVPDGEIDDDTTDEELEYFAEDENFADLMDTFLVLMRSAYRSGGLYFDGVVSRRSE